MTTKLLTIKETADLLRVSERTVRKMVTADVLPHYRVGLQLRFDQDEVLKTLREKSGSLGYYWGQQNDDE